MCPEPLANFGATPLGNVSAISPRALPLRHRSYGLMCHSLGLSPASAFSLVRRVLAGVRSPLLPPGSFPTLSLRIFPWMLIPYPGVHGVLSPVSSTMSSAFPKERMGRLPRLATNYDFSRSVFRGCRYSLMFPASKFASPPDRSTRCAYCCRRRGILRPGPIVLCCLHTHRIC